MLNRLLSSFGIGSAQVDTELRDSNVQQGGFLEGVVKIQGGTVEQHIDDIYLKVMTYVIEKHNDQNVRVAKELYRYHLNEPFLLRAGELYHRPFRFRLPFSTPITKHKSVVWLATGLDIQNAIDPSDKDYLTVTPLPYVEELIRAFEQLGFQCREVESKKAKSHFPSDSGIIQEMEFVAYRGSFRGKFDEVEVWLSPKSTTQVDVIFQLDKRARGFKSAFQEAMGMDESYRKLVITQQNVTQLPFLLQDMFTHV